MFTFLRKIRFRLLGQATTDTVRRSLIDSGSTQKYLLYAVGEIALVVIGIMIALNINNWNNEREERLLENQILKEIHNNLRLDLEEIRSDMSVMEVVNNSCDELIK